MKKLSLILAIVLPVVFAACSKDKGNDSGSIDPAPVLIETTSSASYSPSELTSAIANSKYIKDYGGDDETVIQVLTNVFDLFSTSKFYKIDTIYARQQNVSLLRYQRNWQIETYTFTYNSVSSTGEPIVLSGRVTMPNTIGHVGHKVQSLSLYVHHYIDYDVAPTLVISPFMLRAFYNSAVIEPDLQGYGASEGQPFCGLSLNAQAQQMADCLKAAREVMQQQGVTLADNGFTTLWGYSISTPACVAFARLYEERMSHEEQEAIRLKSIFAGGGPMLMDRFVQCLDVDPDFNASMARYIFTMLKAMPKNEFGGYELQDFMPEWMQTYIVNIGGQDYTYIDALMLDLPGIDWMRPDEYTPKVLKNNFASDMVNAEGHLDYSSPKTQVIMDLFRRLTDWGDWMPQHDIYMVHAINDDHMPFQQANEFYELKKASGHVFLRDLDVDLITQIREGSTHSAATILGSAMIILYEDPAQAYNSK